MPVSSFVRKSPTAFFCSDSKKLFDNTLLGGLDQMAQLLHADRISTLKKSVSSCPPQKQVGVVTGGWDECA